MVEAPGLEFWRHFGVFSICFQLFHCLGQDKQLIVPNYIGGEGEGEGNNETLGQVAGVRPRNLPSIFFLRIWQVEYSIM